MLTALLLLVTATKAGVTFPDAITVEGQKLVLNGLGVREATALKVDVYVAALYLEEKTNDPQAIVDPKATKHIVLRFVRDVDRDDVTKAWREGFEKNGGEAYAAKLQQLNSWMTAMKKGQTLSFTYLPERGGVVVQVNGKTKGMIEGADFARVLFSIFVGPNPPNEGLRSGLLGA